MKQFIPSKHVRSSQRLSNSHSMYVTDKKISLFSLDSQTGQRPTAGRCFPIGRSRRVHWTLRLQLLKEPHQVLQSKQITVVRADVWRLILQEPVVRRVSKINHAHVYPRWKSWTPNAATRYSRLARSTAGGRHGVRAARAAPPVKVLGGTTCLGRLTDSEW